MDALVLAATVPPDFAGAVADLGAGAGAAGLAVLARCPRCQATLVECEPRMVEAARLTLGLAENSALSPRARLLAADVGLSGRARAAAGLGNNLFGFAIMNPPFNAAGDRQSGDGLRRTAHVMAAGLLERWMRTAAAIVEPGGSVAVIVRPETLGEVLAALAGRFGGAEIVPVHPRPEAAAIRIVLRARRGSRARLVLRPPLVLHQAQGQAPTDRAEAIINGRLGLFET